MDWQTTPPNVPAVGLVVTEIMMAVASDINQGPWGWSGLDA